MPTSPLAFGEEQEGRPSGRTWSVAALLLAITDAVTARLGSVVVAGELAGLSRAASGHWYFSLKDAEGAAALVRCAMFRRAASLLDFSPTEGLKVEVRGRVAVYEARGELQLVVESMRRQGAGSLYEQFLRLKARLEAAGLFSVQRRRALPAFPAVLGVVSSPAAAALQDVLTALARRAPQVRIVVYPCLVQGAEAPSSIVEALRQAAEHGQADTLLLVRGGGSMEDLWAFNDERVVRAVAASPIPVVCGVGHETDVTLSDLAADLRAPTPTAAAELAAPVREDLLGLLQDAQRRLSAACERALERQAQRLDLLAQRALRPRVALSSHLHRMVSLESRLVRGVRSRCLQESQRCGGLDLRWRTAAAHAVQRGRWKLQALSTRFEAVNPREVLKRGYAWVAYPDGRPVTHAGALREGDSIDAVFADGQVRATVDGVETTGGSVSSPSPGEVN